MSDAFQQAAQKVKTLPKKPNNEELLKVYGLFKVGSGEDFKSAPKPGMMEFTAKAKYGAWEAANNAHDTPESAQQAYIEYVAELEKKYPSAA